MRVYGSQLLVNLRKDWQVGRKLFRSKGVDSLLLKISNLPIYYLYVLTILMRVGKRLESGRSHFLWGDMKGSRRWVLFSEVR